VSRPANDTSKVVDIISRNNAKILKVTDLYIEGEVSGGSFKRLRKELGFRKVSYAFVRGESGTSSNFIEEVGTLSNKAYMDAETNGNPSRAIRFRVYKE